MKYCKKCGCELVDDAVVCTRCGCASERLQSRSDDSLTTITKIFMVLGVVFTGTLIWPLIFTLPVTILYFRKLEAHEPISTGFKICCLLVSPIAGAIMFVDQNLPSSN